MLGHAWLDSWTAIHPPPVPLTSARAGKNLSPNLLFWPSMPSGQILPTSDCRIGNACRRRVDAVNGQPSPRGHDPDAKLPFRQKRLTRRTQRDHSARGLLNLPWEIP